MYHRAGAGNDPVLRTGLLKPKMNLYLTAMKKYLLWICTAAALLAAGTSCSDDPEVDSVGRVGIQQENLTADGAGEDVTLNVTSNAYWRINFTDPATGESIRWVTASETSGMGNTAVTLKVARNRSTSGRTTYVNVITESESSAASILLSQGAGTIGGGDGYDFPISQTFSIDANLALDNAFIEGAACYFDDGMILRRTGTPTVMEFSTKTHTNPTTNWYFQRGVVLGEWETGDALQLEIPVKDELSGDLRYSYGSRRDGTQSAGHAWAFEWSADGENWTAFDGASSGGASDATWKTIDFTIPAGKKIPAGGKLWIRHRCTDGSKASTSASNKTVAYQSAFCVTKAKAEPTAVPDMNDETVVFSTGFDDVIDAKAAYIDIPLDFMSSWNDGTYALPREQSGIVNVVSCWTRPGFVQVGRGDEALITRYTQGSYTIKLASRFETMRISKSDLKLTFLASAMVDAYGVPTDPGVVVKADAVSGATVEGGTLEGVANNEFKPFTVYVRNATPETEITITSADMASSTDDVRFFLDDIVLEVEGEPQRPSADDPVKTDVSVVRAMKGAGTVTISENYYIQARVVAVDNVPADCFAVQDADAGIFVKLANHGFAAGDQVEVVVKDALLATDADGLLVVTPKAADKVTKTAAPSEIPAYKAVSVVELTAGACEAMLVALPESQVVDADLAKTMGGSVSLELEDHTTYTMKTYASASFASAAVPQKRGAVKGLAGASFLLPTSVGDLAAMTGTRFGQAVYAITPIDGHLYPLGKTKEFTIGNATFDQASKTVTYTDGHSIYKVGDTSTDFTWGCYGTNKAPAPNMYDARLYTTGWGGDNWQENGLVFKIKATSRIVGNLRFGFGWFGRAADNLPKNWKLLWSTDETTWHDGVKVYSIPGTGVTTPIGPDEDPGTVIFPNAGSAGTLGYRTAYFNLPESNAVSEGGYLYMKIVQADNECQNAGVAIDPKHEQLFINGFYLQTHERRAYHYSQLPSGENVVLTEGFDDGFWGPDYFAPSWQMFAGWRVKYTPPMGWTVAGSGVIEMPGYVRIGTGNTDAASSLTTPALELLGDTPTNITVSFKAAVLLVGATSLAPDNMTIKITASGAGTVGSENYFPESLTGMAATTVDQATSDQMCADYIRWYDCSVKVTGATKDTKITFGGTGRHFFDDIVITKD